MRKLVSIGYTAAAFNLAMLILRVGSGVLIMKHGYDKMVHFADVKLKFINFLGIGSATSLSLTIFAEFFCGMFLIIGLFSRLVSIPLVINMAVAVIKGHNGEVFGAGEKAALFLLCFITVLLCGPGKASVDGMMTR